VEEKLFEGHAGWIRGWPRGWAGGKEWATLLRGLLRGLWRGRRGDGANFGTEIGDELGDLRVGEGVAEGRHFLAAVEDLGGDFCGGPGFVCADAGERWGFFATNAVGTVAVGAAFVAEEDGAGFFVGLVAGGVGGEGGGQDADGYEGGKKGLDGLDHEVHFLMERGGWGSTGWGRMRGDARYLHRSG